MTVCRINCTRFWTLLALCSGVGAQLTAAPTITTVLNAASNTPQALPNGSIAQGAIFIVKGSGMGPTNISIAPNPFQSTTLNGTSASITVNNVTASALMYYTSDGQIAALLPSNVPAGTGTITVTYNGQSSAPARFSVIPSSLGIFTVDSSGQGSGIITYPDYSLVSSFKAPNCGGPNTTCGAANPGDTLILWGTGLGRVNGDDASGTGLGQNMPDLPLKLFVGGVQATVLYQGRSGCCIGEDQVVFTVPNNAPTGCAVPVVAQIVNQVSNNVLMPIAQGSRACSPNDTGLPPLDALAQKAAAGPFNLGAIELDHFLNGNGVGFHDTAHFNFLKASVPAASVPFIGAALDNPALGTCLAQPFLGGNNGPLNLIAALDAGGKFTVSGPNGTQTVTANTGDHPSLSDNGSYLVPGDYTITGSGGKDVGPFSVTVNIPSSPIVTSPSSSNGLTVSRLNGMPVTWNPNGSTGTVELVLGSAAGPNVTASVTCRVPASAGSFTIPSSALLSLPNGNGTIFFFQPGDMFPATSVSFSATGLDAGVAQTFVDATSLSGFAIAN